MNRGIRITVAAALALAVAAGVSGCTEANSIYSDAVITSELDGLTRELGELDGVALTYNSSIQPDYTYSVSVEVQVDEPRPETLRTVIERSVETLGGGVLANQKSTFRVMSGEAGIFGSDNLADGQTLNDVIGDDLDYWLALREASGAPLTLGFYGNEAAEDGRTRSISSSVPVDLSALRGVDDPNDVETEWNFPGLYAYGELPSVADEEYFDRATAILPARNDVDFAMPGVGLAFADDSVYMYVTIASVDKGVAVAESETWPAVVALAGLATDRATGFSLTDTEYSFDGVIHFGQCRTPETPRDSDSELLRALVAAGVDLPVGTAAGYCHGEQL